MSVSKYIRESIPTWAYFTIPFVVMVLAIGGGWALGSSSNAIEAKVVSCQ